LVSCTVRNKEGSTYILDLIDQIRTSYVLVKQYWN
jgi:hypothetical protein